MTNEVEAMDVSEDLGIEILFDKDASYDLSLAACCCSSSSSS